MFGLAEAKTEGASITHDDKASGENQKTYSWLDLIRAECAKHGDSMDHAVHLNGDFSGSFSAGYGSVYHAAWIMWTTSRVYMPEIHDGKPSVRSAPRHPCDELFTVDERGL